MTEFPDWDYWMYAHLPDGTPVDIQFKFCEETDIRNPDYDLVVGNWCGVKHFFWTPQEAALISFYRDPDLVERNEDDFINHDGIYAPRDPDDDDGIKRCELMQWITDLYDEILDAQENKILPKPLRRDLYVEWAQLAQVDVPRPVLDALKLIEKQNARETELANEHPALPPKAQQDDLPEDAAHLANKKARSPQTRLEDNQLKIILAFLLRYKLIKKETLALARDLEKELTTAAEPDPNKLGDPGNPELIITYQPIKTRLDEAQQLVQKNL